jgi:hypothetical protein
MDRSIEPTGRQSAMPLLSIIERELNLLRMALEQRGLGE